MEHVERWLSFITLPLVGCLNSLIVIATEHAKHMPQGLMANIARFLLILFFDQIWSIDSFFKKSCHAREFYFLPKVHKEGFYLPGSPFIVRMRSILQPVVQFIDLKNMETRGRFVASMISWSPTHEPQIRWFWVEQVCDKLRAQWYTICHCCGFR